MWLYNTVTIARINRSVTGRIVNAHAASTVQRSWIAVNERDSRTTFAGIHRNQLAARRLVYFFLIRSRNT